MRQTRDERGASAVEFAIIASLLFLILFGTIQFGIAFNRYQGINAAAREGARLGSLQGTDVPTIVQRVKDSLSIIRASDMSYNCPTDSTPPATPEKGCIEVYSKNAALALTPMSNVSSSHPCNVSGGKSVVVQVSWRMNLQIPLWTAAQIPISVKGEFACEI